jgi:uncharacterized OsmC-like protein
MSQRIIDIELKDNKRVEVLADGHVIPMDQSEKDGGDDSAPSPFSMFMASITACAAMYARGFCALRDIPTDELKVRAVCDFDDDPYHMKTMTIEVVPPPELPAKYHKALARAVDLCFVKKHIVDPPEIVTSVLEAE